MMKQSILKKPTFVIEKKTSPTSSLNNVTNPVSFAENVKSPRLNAMFTNSSKNVRFSDFNDSASEKFYNFSLTEKKYNFNSDFNQNNTNNETNDKEIKKSTSPLSKHSNNAKKYYNKAKMVPVKEINLIGYNYELIVAAQPDLNSANSTANITNSNTTNALTNSAAKKLPNENFSFSSSTNQMRNFSPSKISRSISVTPTTENNRIKYLSAKLLRNTPSAIHHRPRHLVDENLRQPQQQQSDTEEEHVQFEYFPPSSIHSDQNSYFSLQRNLNTVASVHPHLQQQQQQSNPISMSSMSTASSHQTTIHYLQNTTFNNIKHLKQGQNANRSHKSSIFLPSTNHNFQNINELHTKVQRGSNSSVLANSLSLPRGDSAAKSKATEPSPATGLSLIKESPGLTLYAYLLKNNPSGNNDPSNPQQAQPQPLTLNSSRSQNLKKITTDNLEMRHFVPRLHKFNNPNNQIINNAVVYNTDNYLRSIVQLTESEISDLNDSNEIKIIGQTKTSNLIFNPSNSNSNNNNNHANSDQLSTSRSSQINQFKLTTSKLNSNQIF